MHNIEELKSQALAGINAADNLALLEDLRLRYVGKKGELTSLMKSVGRLPAQERPKAGAALNVVKQAVEAAITERESTLKREELNKRLNDEEFDITLPGRRRAQGHQHPLGIVNRELTDIFVSLGFSVEEGPEVETDEQNFKKLNFPDDHPARDMQDTFYVQNQNFLLRTHTSPVQVHAMEKTSPPLSIIAPGRVFRCDSDITHSPVFHQLEGFHVDVGVSMADLKGILELFVHRLYGKQTKIRLRPSFFPFTEPSAEMDISCPFCGGKGCRICKQTGWIEILGAGMIDPNVLIAVDIDPEKYSGFAFGIGIERVAMIRYGIYDIRLLFENDPRFLEQF